MAPTLVVADAPYKVFPGGVIAIRCTDWLGAARASLTTEVDTRAITGGTVRDTQQVAALIATAEVAAFQEADDTLVTDLSTLPLETDATNGMTYLIYCSLLVEGDWDPADTDTTRASAQHLFEHTCRVGWYGDDNSPTDATPNWAVGLPRKRPHYVIVQLENTASIVGDETLRFRAFTQAAATTEVLLDQIFFVPIVFFGTKMGEWRPADFAQVGGAHNTFGAISFNPPDAGGFVDGADGGDANGKFTWEPYPGETPLISDPSSAGGGDFQKSTDNEYMLRVVTDDFYYLANSQPAPDAEAPAHAYSIHGSMYREEQDWINDPFTRTVADGWGIDPLGFGYRHTAGNTSVNGAQGILTPGISGTPSITFANRGGFVNSLGAKIADLDFFEWSGVFEYDTLPTHNGGGDYNGPWTRFFVRDLASGPSGYRGVIHLFFQPVDWSAPEYQAAPCWWLQGADNLFPAPSADVFHGPVDISAWFAAGDPVGYRIELKRYRLRVKIWDATGAEPGAWDYDDFPPLSHLPSGTPFPYPFDDKVDYSYQWGPFNLFLESNTENDNSGHSTLWDDMVIKEIPYGTAGDMTATVEQPHGTQVGTIDVPYGAQQMVYWGARDWTTLDAFSDPYLDFSSKVWNESGTAELQRAEAPFWYFRSVHGGIISMNWREAERSGEATRVLVSGSGR